MKRLMKLRVPVLGRLDIDLIYPVCRAMRPFQEIG